MTCPECETRRRHIAESERILKARWYAARYEGQLRRFRLAESAEHQLRQARENLEHHLATCGGGE